MDTYTEIKRLKLADTPTMRKNRKKRKGLLDYKFKKLGHTLASELEFQIRYVLPDTGKVGETPKKWR